MFMCIILHREHNLAMKNESLHQIQTCVQRTLSY